MEQREPCQPDSQVTAGSSDIARDADYLLCANVGKHTARLLDGAASDAIDAVRKYDASL